MAENLITDKELGLWVDATESEIAADDFAQDIIEKMSAYTRFLGFAPKPADEWGWETIDDVPIDVRLIVLKVCRRTYENVREVVQEGNIGPIGGDRVRDEAAQGMELTEGERATIVAYNPAGDPTNGASEGLWVQPTYVGDENTLPVEVLYVGDNQQINLGNSADPREWKIPLFNPGDPGSPSRYPED